MVAGLLLLRGREAGLDAHALFLLFDGGRDDALLFGDGLGLGEEEEIVGAAGFAVGARHIEATEGMSADHGAGALAVEVKVADVEVGAGAVELFAGAGVDGSGEAILGVVGDAKGVIEAGGFDDGEKRAEDFFLRDAGGGGDVSDDSGGDEVAVGGGVDGVAAGEDAAFGAANGDVVEETLVGGGVDDGSGVGVVFGEAGDDAGDALGEAVAEGVIDGLFDDDAGTGGALLAVEAEGRGGDAFDGEIEVAVSVDDDGVLAAELKDGALEEALARLGAGGALVDFEADLLGAGECDEVDFGVLDDDAAGLGATLDEVDDAVGKADFLEEFEEAGGDGGRVGGGLEHDSVAGDDGGRGHAGHDGEGEVPGRDDGADAERHVTELVAFAGELDGRLGSVEAEGFAGVELEEVDALANVGVGFGEVLSDFEGEPGAELEVAGADESGGAEKEIDAVGNGRVGPAGKGSERGLDGGGGLSGRGGVVGADDLRGVRGIDGGEGFGGLRGVAAEDEVVCTTELGAHVSNGREHGAMVFGGGEVGEGLVGKRRKCLCAHDEGVLRVMLQDHGSGFVGAAAVP